MASGWPAWEPELFLPVSSIAPARGWGAREMPLCPGASLERGSSSTREAPLPWVSAGASSRGWLEFFPYSG